MNPGNLSSGLERAKLFEKIGNSDSAVIIVNLILRESAQTGDSSVVAPASLELGHYYLDCGNYNLAKVYYSKVISSAPADLLLKVRALTGMGSAMANTGHYPEAVKKYHEAMEIFLNNGDSLNAHIQLPNLAEVHSENRKYEQASQFNQRASAGFMLHRDTAKLAECFIILAIYHKNLGKEPVLDYYDRAAGIFTALGDSVSIIKIVYNKAAFELQQLYQVTALEQKNLLLTRENEWRRKQFNAARNIGVLMSAFALTVSVLLVIVYRFYVSRKLAYHALFDIYRSQKPVTDFTSDQGNTGAINKSTEDNDQILDIQEISNKLNHLLDTEKVFRDKFLSSERLAEKLGISRRELSNYLQKVHNQALTTAKPFIRPSGGSQE